MAAVAVADNWRNVLREPLERISLVFIVPSSNVAKVFAEKIPVPYSGRKMKPGWFLRPAPHYSTESGEDLSGSCNNEGSANALAFWMAINEKFDSEDRIDSSALRALSFFFCEVFRIVEAA
jgi:hypothetical protein